MVFLIFGVEESPRIFDYIINNIIVNRWWKETRPKILRLDYIVSSRFLISKNLTNNIINRWWKEIFTISRLDSYGLSIVYWRNAFFLSSPPGKRIYQSSCVSTQYHSLCTHARDRPTSLLPPLLSLYWSLFILSPRPFQFFYSLAREKEGGRRKSRGLAPYTRRVLDKFLAIPNV